MAGSEHGGRLSGGGPHGQVEDEVEDEVAGVGRGRGPRLRITGIVLGDHTTIRAPGKYWKAEYLLRICLMKPMFGRDGGGWG